MAKQKFARQTSEFIRTQQARIGDPLLCFHIPPLHHRLRCHHHRPFTANKRPLLSDDAQCRTIRH